MYQVRDNGTTGSTVHLLFLLVQVGIIQREVYVFASGFLSFYRPPKTDIATGRLRCRLAKLFLAMGDKNVAGSWHKVSPFNYAHIDFSTTLERDVRAGS